MPSLRPPSGALNGLASIAQVPNRISASQKTCQSKPTAKRETLAQVGTRCVRLSVG